MTIFHSEVAQRGVTQLVPSWLYGVQGGGPNWAKDIRSLLSQESLGFPVVLEPTLEKL